ncbi:PaaI family thioesterase [Zavarzinia sp. CC-PAN008]|uniref:PaaI family thioesterase n=1 Tax=Zavarzinia sp. CC-PAN008 TaxID=3243332 RepID=UPI003F74A2F5
MTGARVLSRPQDNVPEGWEEMTLSDPFEQVIGPFYHRRTERGRDFAFRAGARHFNTGGAGVVHGGMILSFLDASLGACAYDAIRPGHAATLNLSTEFVSAAKLGDWVECRCEVLRQTRSILFVRGMLLANDKVVANASSLWKVIGA